LQIPFFYRNIEKTYSDNVNTDLVVFEVGGGITLETLNQRFSNCHLNISNEFSPESLKKYLWIGFCGKFKIV